jgi:outer membrane protein OmpA-like peptidoglycan-associated protein
MRRASLALMVVVACAPARSPTPLVETSKPRTQRSTAPRERVVVTDTEIERLDPVEFLPGSTTLEPHSIRTLDAVATTLTGNPNIALVAVHTVAPDALAQLRRRLAADRANVVIAHLVSRGVARTRLVPDPAAGSPGAATEFLILRWNQ